MPSLTLTQCADAYSEAWEIHEDVEWERKYQGVPREQNLAAERAIASIMTAIAVFGQAPGAKDAQSPAEVERQRTEFVLYGDDADIPY